MGILREEESGLSLPMYLAIPRAALASDKEASWVGLGAGVGPILVVGALQPWDQAAGEEGVPCKMSEGEERVPRFLPCL